MPNDFMARLFSLNELFMRLSEGAWQLKHLTLVRRNGLNVFQK